MSHQLIHGGDSRCPSRGPPVGEPNQAKRVFCYVGVRGTKSLRRLAHGSEPCQCTRTREDHEGRLTRRLAMSRSKLALVAAMLLSGFVLWPQGADAAKFCAQLRGGHSRRTS